MCMPDVSEKFCMSFVNVCVALHHFLPSLANQPSANPLHHCPLVHTNTQQSFIQTHHIQGLISCMLFFSIN